MHLRSRGDICGRDEKRDEPGAISWIPFARVLLNRAYVILSVDYSRRIAGGSEMASNGCSTGSTGLLSWTSIPR